MANNCKFYNSIVVSFDVFSREIILYKCCYKHQPNEFIKRYSVEEWKSLDAYSEFEKYINDFGENHDRSIDSYCRKMGAEDECFKTGNTLERVCVYLNYACNANCSFCTEFSFRRDHLIENPEISAELKQLYFETLYSLKGKGLEIELTAVGEPFFYKRDMKAFFASCKKEDFTRISFVTNASLFDDEYFELMKNTGIELCGLVSLNCSSELSYNEIMRLRCFGKTLDNILKLSKIANITVSFVIDEPTLKYKDEYTNIFECLAHNGIPYFITPNGNKRELKETEEYKFIESEARRVHLLIGN